MPTATLDNHPIQVLAGEYGIRVSREDAAAALLTQLRDAGASTIPVDLDAATNHVLALAAHDFDTPIPAPEGPDKDLRSALEVLRCCLLESVVSSSNVRSLLDALPTFVVVCDRLGRTVDANHRALATLDLEGGQPITALVPELVLAEGAPQQEILVRDTTLLFSTAPLRSAYDDIDGWVVVGMDISTQAAARAELEQAGQIAESHARARATFIANTSHEIRTPLHGIIGASELLSQTRLEQEQRDLLRAVLDSGNHLSALIDSVIDLTRIDANAMDLERVPMSITSAAHTALAALAPEARNKGIGLGMTVHKPREHVLGDPLRVRQILVNLIGNAVKFTQQGRVDVHVHTIRQGPSVDVTIEVRDTGIGIDADKVDLIFDVFEQGERDTSRRFGGSGLGLAIARRLAVAMNGDIVVNSEPGRGSTFVVTMRLDHAAHAPEVQLDPQRDVALPSGRRVLVVDDNAVNLLVAKRMLQSLGVDVVTSTGGERALTLLVDGSFDAVLMDCQMPEIDGFETTRRWREREGRLGLSPVPIVALTASAAPTTRERSFSSGMNDFLTKPLHVDALRAALQRWLVRT